MSYIKINWQDSPSTSTPMNADNLNHMDEGIADVDERVGTLEGESKVSSFNSRSGAVSPAQGDYSIEQISPSEGAEEGQVPTVDENGNFVMQTPASVPTQLSDLSDDATHRTVSDTEKNTWNTAATNTANTAYLSGLRFKNLGTSFTSAQATALAAGDFSDFWNGDYWNDTAQGIVWRIVDNTGIARRRGDTNFDKPSLIIMPDAPLIAADGSTHLMNDTDTTAGGYAGTKYRSTYRSTCKTKFDNFFGSAHIASHRELLCNAVTSGKPSGWAWADCDIELPSEANIYGHNAWSGYTDGGSGYNIGTQWGQFRLFALAPYTAINRSHNYWLRDVVSASWFAFVGDIGHAAIYGASNPWVGLRPLGIII